MFKIKEILFSMSWLRWVYRRQGLLLRILVCWALASLAVLNDEKNDFDTRFQIRGMQKVSPQIVLLNIKPSDLSRYYDPRVQNLLNLNQGQDFSESFFWDPQMWNLILKSLLNQNPKAIGVTLFFGQDFRNQLFTEEENRVFFDPRVFWATQLNSYDQSQSSVLAKNNHYHSGLINFMTDEDGQLRKIMTQNLEYLTLPEKLSGQPFPKFTTSQFINFRGSQNLYTNLNLVDLLSGDLPKNYLQNKIIIIGAHYSVGNHFLTPIGALSRADVVAQITDNLIHNRWIKKYPPMVYLIYSLLLVILAVLIISHYPQGVAFFFYCWIGLLTVCLSIWFFDVINVWIPALSTLFLLITVWIVFVGYQASRIERRNFMLEQEQKYLHELEQLKSNFVSLISHDLKTPLAKIQGVLDRIKSTPHSPELNPDLVSLENSTEELNRYIQSILKVMRVESKDFQIQTVSTDLNEIIEEVVLSLQPLAELKRIQIRTTLEPLFLVDLDPTLIREVVHNLIENAIKYSPENHPIDVKSFENESEIGFFVQDFGEGIPQEETLSVWGKFVRGQGQSHKSKGSGLGLYLVKYFIELHGGRVTLQSELGRGTQVGFYLPL